MPFTTRPRISTNTPAWRRRPFWTRRQRARSPYAVFDVRDVSVQALLKTGADVRLIAGPPLEEGLWACAEGATG